MIKLKFSELPESERTEKVKMFAFSILENRSLQKNHELNEWVKNNIKVQGVSSFKDVIEAEPNVLEQIKEAYDQLSKEQKHTLYKQYIVNTLYEHMRKETRQLFFKTVNNSVCPYCNHDHIIFDDDYARGELDHYYPKDKYPLLAAFFYNLIPCCHYCNHKKGDVSFVFYPYEPKDSTDEILRFEYVLTGANVIDENSYQSCLKVLMTKYKEQFNCLHLQEIYSSHRRKIKDLVLKYLLCNNSWMEVTRKQFAEKGISISESDIYNFYFGYGFSSSSEKDYTLKPLSKFMWDIYEELKQENPQ